MIPPVWHLNILLGLIGTASRRKLALRIATIGLDVEICAGGSFPASALFEVKASADATDGGTRAAADAANGRATTTRLLLRLTSAMFPPSDVLSIVVIAGARNAAKLAVHLDD